MICPHCQKPIKYGLNEHEKDQTGDYKIGIQREYDCPYGEGGCYDREVRGIAGDALTYEPVDTEEESSAVRGRDEARADAAKLVEINQRGIASWKADIAERAARAAKLIEALEWISKEDLRRGESQIGEVADAALEEFEGKK